MRQTLHHRYFLAAIVLLLMALSAFADRRERGNAVATAVGNHCATCAAWGVPVARSGKFAPYEK